MYLVRFRCERLIGRRAFFYFDWLISVSEQTAAGILHASTGPEFGQNIQNLTASATENQFFDYI